MEAINTVLPILLILGLAALLARTGFLHEAFAEALNRVVYWIALPALIVAKLAAAQFSGQALGSLLLVYSLATLLIAALAEAGWRLARVPRRDAGTLIQAAFRGNLAYIGIPILAYSVSDLPESAQADALSLAFLLLGPCMILYNVLAVYVLQRSQAGSAGTSARLLFLRMARNPLIVAAVIGLLLNPITGELPTPIDRTLETLGQLAIPGALLCIGYSLGKLQIRGRRTLVLQVSLLKVVVLPAIVALLALPFAFSEVELRLLLLFAAAPTAAASHIMAVQMGGNEDLAAGTIAVSTLLSPASLILVLLLV